MDFDVLIVGAGPAGAAAARCLAEGGAAVALVDADKFPRHKPCAGWISRKAVDAWPFVDAARRDVDAAPFRRLVFHAPDASASAEYASRSHLGYVADRDAFDAALLRAAEDAGAEPVLGQAVTEVMAGEDGVAVVLKRGRRLTGRILVGADGVHSTVARETGLRARWGDGQLVYTLSATVSLTARQMRACFGSSPPIHVSPAFGGAHGYAWAFPGPRHVSVGVGARRDEADRLKALFARWWDVLAGLGIVPEKTRRPKGEAYPIPAGAAVEFEHHVGKRTVLVGDAGGFVSAATGEGIYPGIRSAVLAAECILAALEAGDGKRAGSTCQDELLRFRGRWRREMAGHLQMPNVNVTFLLPLIYTNQEICDRFARAFLFGENL
ncbi:MAG: NAD(P)/FAD-dependent oxidoreductase [Phycisphaerae bacterium]